MLGGGQHVPFAKNQNRKQTIPNPARSSIQISQKNKQRLEIDKKKYHMIALKIVKSSFQANL